MLRNSGCELSLSWAWATSGLPLAVEFGKRSVIGFDISYAP